MIYFEVQNLSLKNKLGYINIFFKSFIIPETEMKGSKLNAK